MNTIVNNELSISEEIEVFAALENRHEAPVPLYMFEEGIRFAEALNSFGTEHLRLLPGMALVIQSVFVPRVAGVEMLPLRRCFDRLKDELRSNDKAEVNAAYRSLSVPFFAFMRRREEKGRHGGRTDSSMRVRYGKTGAKVSHSWRISQSAISESEKRLAATATEFCRRVALEVLRRPALVCTLKGGELELIISRNDVPEWFKAIQPIVAEMLKPTTEGTRPDKAGALALVKEEALLELRRRQRKED